MDQRQLLCRRSRKTQRHELIEQGCLAQRLQDHLQSRGTFHVHAAQIVPQKPRIIDPSDLHLRTQLRMPQERRSTHTACLHRAVC